ncbi:MAG: ferredoxin:glutaredoxin reductase [Candidatus Latescibacteria bacterium]|jgi:ferredoxin-thioredoxin reductase catalytic subunit|nr:ferredoxin:glutaredoxin reductase [Candidatus Latescibacterota bacterium]
MDVTDQEVDSLYKRLDSEAIQSGYNINPDIEFTRDLIQGLIINEKRYGYLSCPCRLASGNKNNDLDIICPCDYRDTDLVEFGTCYCGLYVSEEIISGKKIVTKVPERRPLPSKRENSASESEKLNVTALPHTVWRCRVCGYLCAREEPPEVCPICKVAKERFERFR